MLDFGDGCVAGVTSTRTKILAYLGEIRGDEYISAKKLCFDLNLRFTTAKNTLTLLEERGLVEKKIETIKGTKASFRIDPTAMQPGIGRRQADNGKTVMLPYIPPEWSDAYGKHPYSV